MTQKNHEKGDKDAFRDTPRLPLNPMCTRCAVNRLLGSCSLETGVGPKIRPGWVDVSTSLYVYCR